MNEAPNPFDNTDISQQSFAYADLTGSDAWSPWTPIRTGWTDVGTPTVTGRFKVVGKQCFIQVKVVPSTSIATTAGTSYIALPIAAKGFSGAVAMYNATTNIIVGMSGIDVTNSRAHLPTQGASGNTFAIFGQYEI